jgi:hypothetical protein
LTSGRAAADYEARPATRLGGRFPRGPGHSASRSLEQWHQWQKVEPKGNFGNGVEVQAMVNRARANHDGLLGVGEWECGVGGVEWGRCGQDSGFREGRRSEWHVLEAY